MKNFNKLIQAKFADMCKTGKLYRVNLTGQQIWDLYMANFKPANDLVFRSPDSTEHNCNFCKNFVRRYGNIVSINDKFELETIWDVACEEEYLDSVSVMSAAIKGSKISEVFFETFNELNSLPYEKTSPGASVYRLGVDKNVKRYTKEEAELYPGVVKPNEVRTFEHMHLDLPKAFVDQSGKSVESIMGEFRDAKNVFQRAMEEIPLDTLNLVRDLIIQDSLLDGATHLQKVETFAKLKDEYDNVKPAFRDNWTWMKSFRLPIAKFKNELVGVLCSELAEGKELNEACQAWNKRVDPANYMKATAPITKKQIEEAKKFVEQEGYEESFNRRLANIDDIKVTEILHSNVGDGKIANVSIFDGVKSTSTRHKRSEFEDIEEVDIDKFMTKVLPTVSSVEVYLKNNHEGNMVSLTTANNPDSKKIMKWDNNYSWTFSGNLAGKSQLADMVQAKGGRTDGAFRFTHSWNELEPNGSLMDLHVFMPGCKVPKTGGGPDVSGRRVGWNNRTDSLSGGVQDVDYTSVAPAGYIPVENITFPSIGRMPEGVYTCAIHNWSFRSTGGRGRAEIAFDGNVYQYIYPVTKHHQWIVVAEVTLKAGKFTIEHVLPLENETTKEIYGLETNNFHKVNLVCLSPNHWNGNNVGNKHYMFMLDKCKTPSSIRSFHVENLNADLLKHKKVMEVLGTTTMISPADKQLSGLGFNATVRDELIVKVGGTHKRMLKIKF